MLLRSRRFGSWDIVQSDAGALGSARRGPVCCDPLKGVLIARLVDGRSSGSWIS